MPPLASRQRRWKRLSHSALQQATLAPRKPQWEQLQELACCRASPRLWMSPRPSSKTSALKRAQKTCTCAVAAAVAPAAAAALLGGAAGRASSLPSMPLPSSAVEKGRVGGADPEPAPAPEPAPGPAPAPAPPPAAVPSLLPLTLALPPLRWPSCAATSAMRAGPASMSPLWPHSWQKRGSAARARGAAASAAGAASLSHSRAGSLQQLLLPGCTEKRGGTAGSATAGGSCAK